jgi:hypothetical protein
MECPYVLGLLSSLHGTLHGMYQLHSYLEEAPVHVQVADTLAAALKEVEEWQYQVLQGSLRMLVCVTSQAVQQVSKDLCRVLQGAHKRFKLGFGTAQHSTVSHASPSVEWQPSMDCLSCLNSNTSLRGGLKSSHGSLAPCLP